MPRTGSAARRARDARFVPSVAIMARTRVADAGALERLRSGTAAGPHPRRWATNDRAGAVVTRTRQVPDEARVGSAEAPARNGVVVVFELGSPRVERALPRAEDAGARDSMLEILAKPSSRGPFGLFLLAAFVAAVAAFNLPPVAAWVRRHRLLERARAS